MKKDANDLDLRDDNSKREMMLQTLKKTILAYGEKHKVLPDITLAALYELEYALIYECKSTYHLTDGQIEKIKMESKKRHDGEHDKIARSGDFI